MHCWNTRWQREPELCLCIASTGVNISSLNSGLIPRPGGSAWEQGFTSCTHTPSAFVLLQHMVYFRSDNWVTTTATRELCQLRRAWESPEPSIYRLSLSFNFLFKDGCLCFCFTRETAKTETGFPLELWGSNIFCLHRLFFTITLKSFNNNISLFKTYCPV